MWNQIGYALSSGGKRIIRQAPVISRGIVKKIGAMATTETGQKIITETAIALTSAAVQRMVDKISNKNTNMSLSNRLKELDKLKRAGKLTSNEYEKIREKIIANY